MAAMEQPFGENEIRYFLAEVLKKSSIAPQDLMTIIQERGIQPSWYEIALPNGRSVSSCILVWQQLQANAARFTAPIQPMVAFEQPFPQSASKPKKKRPTSGENVPSAVDRMIQPQQPFNFLPVNSSNDPATEQGATASAMVGPPRKKRGRPSKAEYEAKVAEAAARGEEYQPAPKRKKTPRPSLQGAPNPGMITPGRTEVRATDDGSTGKERAPKPTVTPENPSSLASEPTTRNLHFGPTAHATNTADHMQMDRGKPFRTTISGRQDPEFDARENLFAGMREHAEYGAPQSTLTLQHESTPQNPTTYYQGQRRNPASTGEQHIP